MAVRRTSRVPALSHRVRVPRQHHREFSVPYRRDGFHRVNARQDARIGLDAAFRIRLR
jgi:hypothetical protein